MEHAVIVKGRVTDSRHIELDEPVEEVTGEVEVTVRPVEPTGEEERTDVEALVRIEEAWRTRHPDRLRSKSDLDRCISEERASWGDDGDDLPRQPHPPLPARRGARVPRGLDPIS